MSLYPPKIDARFLSPQNAGKLPPANAVGTNASFECGSIVRIFLEIEHKTRAIKSAKFQTNGCGYMIAAADAVTGALAGRKLTDLHGLTSKPDGILSGEREEFPPGREQCAEVVLAALKGSLTNYRASVLEEFSGEKALICTCFGVSEETIEAYIAANSPTTIASVSDACRAGDGCGSCRMLIQEMIDNRDFGGSV